MGRRGNHVVGVLGLAAVGAGAVQVLRTPSVCEADLLGRSPVTFDVCNTWQLPSGPLLLALGAGLVLAWLVLVTRRPLAGLLALALLSGGTVAGVSLHRHRVAEHQDAVRTAVAQLRLPHLTDPRRSCGSTLCLRGGDAPEVAIDELVAALDVDRRERLCDTGPRTPFCAAVLHGDLAGRRVRAVVPLFPAAVGTSTAVTVVADA